MAMEHGSVSPATVGASPASFDAFKSRLNSVIAAKPVKLLERGHELRQLWAIGATTAGIFGVDAFGAGGLELFFEAAGR